MATGYMSPVSMILQIFSDQGVVGSGYKIFTYVGGSVSTPQNTWTDSTLSVLNSNPIVLTSAGRLPNTAVWVPGGTLLKIVITDANGAPIAGGTIDNIPAINDLSTTGFFGLSPGEIANSVVPVNFGFPPGWIYRYGQNSIPGTTDMSTAFASAVQAQNVVRVPADTYRLANVTVAKDNVSILGDDWNTILVVGSANSTLFTVTGQNFTLSGCQWQGDGTTSSSQNGVGVYLNGAGGARFLDNYSTGFGFGAISGVAATALNGPQIIRHKCRATGTGGNEFYLGGVWVDTLIEDPNCFSATADRCLLLYDNSTTGWTGLIVRGGSSTQYLKQQWATTDENWDGTNRVWDVLIDGVRCKNSNWSAVKCKTSRGVKVVNCNFDACGLAQEDQASGLYGDVLVNSLGDVLIANNTFRNSGSCAVKCNTALVSQYPLSTPGGQAISVWNVSHNQIENTGVVFSAQGYGINLADGMKNIILDGNNMRGVVQPGFYAVQTSVIPFFDLTYTNNTIQDSPGASPAVSIAYGQSLRMEGNLCQNFGNVGVQLDNITDIRIGPTDSVLDATTTGGYGYQVGNFRNLSIKARAGNSTYTTWVALTAYGVGARVFNGANVYEAVVAGTSGNTGGPVNTSGASTDGSVTWYFIGKYLMLSYGVRIVGSANGKADLDFDPAGCNTGPIANLVLGAGGTRIHYKTSIATTDATPTNAQVIPIPDTTAWLCEMKVLAQDSATPNRAGYIKYGLFYRIGAGTALQGGLTIAYEVESDAAWNAIPAASGNNLAPAQVTGAAGKNINWDVDVSLSGMP